MLVIMPAHVELESDLEQQLLTQLGTRLRDARVARGLPASTLAQQLGVSRTTLNAVESGSASVTMGTYVRVLSALGMAADLVMLGTRVAEPISRHGAPGADGDLHRRQDLRSLAIHEEAVRVLRRDPAKAQRALDVLDRWEGTSDPHSKPLRDQWRQIINKKQWTLAVENSERGRQLRQASPLGFVLDGTVRAEILRRYSRASLNEPLAA